MSTISDATTIKGVDAHPDAAAAPHESPNPFLFIVGSPRSGTTLLRRMIDSHPEIAVTLETHWIPLYFENRTGLTEDGYVTGALLPELFGHKRFPHLGLDPEAVQRIVVAGGRIHYREFVARLFDLYGKRMHKRLVGDKTPPYVRKIAVLHELWPNARFVHLIRDGRDVCLSVLKWRMAHKTAGARSTWAEDPVSTTALWWEWLIRLGREAGEALPPGLYYEMSYEHLMSAPERQLRLMCEFLGVPFDDRMMRFHEGKTRHEAGLSANAAWLPLTPGLRDWRSQMPREDLERFEAAAGETLAEFGFERAAAVPSPAALRHAALLRSRFDGKPLPRGWSGRFSPVR